MRQSIKEILKGRVDKQGVEDEMVDAMGIANDLYLSIYEFYKYSDSTDLIKVREKRGKLIKIMNQTQIMLWEFQLILDIDDLERQAEDYIEWQELQSIPH